MTIGAGWDLVREILALLIGMAEELCGRACGVAGTHVVRRPSDRAQDSSLLKIPFPGFGEKRREYGK